LFQGSPRVRFNKEGSLLAVTTNDNGIKILANGDGMRLLRMLESRAFDLSRGQVDTKIAKVIHSSSYSNLLTDVVLRNIRKYFGLGLF
jgi:hypothetical protein